MRVYAIKILPEFECAALMNDKEDFLGLVSLQIAKSIISQHIGNYYRWAGFKDEYDCKIFRGHEGPVFWFDAMYPLMVPSRYILKKCKRKI